MKYIFKFLIILIITLSTSACFDSLYHLQVAYVQAPESEDLNGDDPKCVYNAPTVDGDYTSYAEGVMDLEYTKIANSLTHMYGYSLRLAVFNISSEKAEDNVNTIHVRKATVKVYDEANGFLNQEVIETDVTINPQEAVAIPLRIFNNVADWELDNTGTPDTSIDYLYSFFVEKNAADGSAIGLSTQFVTVDVVFSGETLSGVAVTSDHFRFKINLCLGCLYQDSFCAGAIPTIICGPQDHPIYCKSLDAE